MEDAAQGMKVIYRSSNDHDTVMDLVDRLNSLTTIFDLPFTSDRDLGYSLQLDPRVHTTCLPLNLAL